MAKDKSRTGGPHIKNSHLIGKGGGRVKPVDGSWAKGVSKTRKPPTKPAKKNIKEHISTQPAKSAPTAPQRGKTLSTEPIPKVTMAKVAPAKKSIPKVKAAPTKSKPAPAKPKPLPAAPPKGKPRSAPKKATPTKTKTVKGPSKGR